MSMAGYTKLFNSILASTIWRAPNTTRIVWITMLAMADKDGVVEGSVPGLADFARVSVADVETALEELLAPDPYSRTEDYEGRRIEAVPGTGWRLLNHAKYRAKMNEDERREYNRKKQAEWRARHNPSKNVNDSQSQSAMSAQAEAKAKATNTKTSKRRDVVEELLAGLPPVFAADAAFVRALRDYEAFRVEQKHKPWAPATVKKKHAEWSKRNPSEVAEALEKSVAQGYQGVFLNPKPQKKEFTFRDVE